MPVATVYLPRLEKDKQQGGAHAGSGCDGREVWRAPRPRDTWNQHPCALEVAVRRKAFLFPLLALGMSVLALAQTRKPLTNTDVIEMVRAGFDEETIVKAMKANNTNFDISVGALVELKNAGVGKSIIDTMLEAEAKKRPSDPAPPPEPDSSSAAGKSLSAALAGLPEAPGIYAKVKGTYVEVMSELVNWRTGGILKKMATMGMTRGHMNGTVNGRHSRLRLSQPIEILLRGPSGVPVTEVQLLKLDEHRNRREFRLYTGGVFNASGGSDKNAVPFDFKTISPRMAYELKLTALRRGEYGFLVGDRLSTFSVLE